MWCFVLTVGGLGGACKAKRVCADHHEPARASKQTNTCTPSAYLIPHHGVQRVRHIPPQRRIHRVSDMGHVQAGVIGVGAHVNLGSQDEALRAAIWIGRGGERVLQRAFSSVGESVEGAGLFILFCIVLYK